MGTSENNEQFLKLYRACEKDLFGYILALLPQHVDALDVLQETASDLWRQFDRYDDQRPFGVWARKFAHLRVLRFYERAKAQKRSTVLPGDEVLKVLAVEQEQHEGVLELRRKALAICMRKLTDAERHLLEFRYWTDQTLRDLAETVGETERQLQRRLVVIRTTLQKCINKTLPELEGI